MSCESECSRAARRSLLGFKPAITLCLRSRAQIDVGSFYVSFFASCGVCVAEDAQTPPTGLLEV